MREFTIAEARAALPEVLSRTSELIELRAAIANFRAPAGEGGSLADLKGLEARFTQLLSELERLGASLRGYAPLLVDFPGTLDDHPVAWCWLEGERSLDWYHTPEQGFAGRRRIPDSD